MRSRFAVWVLFGTILFSGVLATAQTGLSPAAQLKLQLARVGVQNFIAPNYRPGLVRHIVLFRYERGVSLEQKQEVIQRFLALKSLALRDRNYYVGNPVVTDSRFFDPAHQAFKEFVGPLLDKDASGNVNGALVFDYTR